MLEPSNISAHIEIRISKKFHSALFDLLSNSWSLRVNDNNNNSTQK